MHVTEKPLFQDLLLKRKLSLLFFLNAIVKTEDCKIIGDTISTSNLLYLYVSNNFAVLFFAIAYVSSIGQIRSLTFTNLCISRIPIHYTM